MDILSIVFLTLSISFAIAYISAAQRIKNLTESLGHTILSNTILQYQNNGSKDEQEIHKENFIKFLSDSREWAFSYIEQVQGGLKKFIEEVEPQIEYYDKYGVVIEGMAPPHDFALKKISIELKELKKLLPEEAPDDRR